MTADTRKPDNFDWVTARRKCSAGEVFETLLAGARANVEAMATATDGQTVNLFKLSSLDGSFSVSRPRFSGLIGVRFYLADQEIIAEPFRLGGAGVLTATLTLNDDGECRLLVEGVELQPWQFLKRALEPLLFGVSDW